MIYRHYKGGLYYLLGYATPLYNEACNKDGTTIEVVAVAKDEETMQDVNVFIVYDKNVKGTYYAYDSKDLHGVYSLYRDLNGQHWLRPREKFHGEVNLDGYKIQRFTKMKSESLFDIISKLSREEIV
jgi:hypothetical protein